MPITLEWFNEQETISITTFEGEWTLEEFRELLEQVDHMMGDKQEPFVSIGDFTNSVTPPRKFLAMGRRVNTEFNRNRILVVMIRPGNLIEMLYNALSRLYPRSFGSMKIANSREEALEIARTTLNGEYQPKH